MIQMIIKYIPALQRKQLAFPAVCVAMEMWQQYQ